MIHSPELLFPDVLCLDGISRSGKFLLGKIVSNFTRVEYFQYKKMVENIPILHHLGLMEKNVATALFRNLLNMYVYEQAIGRGLNMRAGDASRVNQSSDFIGLADRMRAADGPAAVASLRSTKKYTPFITHECLSLLPFLQDATPNMKMIHIERHPVDIIHSLCQRGYGGRYGNDPLAFDICLTSCVPWFAQAYAEEYAELSPVDRVIKNVLTLMRPAMVSERVLVVHYEHFFSKINEVLLAIAFFLDEPPRQTMPYVLRREGCELRDLAAARSSKFEVLRKSASPALLEELATAAEAYELKLNKGV